MKKFRTKHNLYDGKKEKRLFIGILLVGILLILYSLNLFSYLPLASISATNSNGVSVSMHSTPIAHPYLLSVTGLTSATEYKWTLTVTNTGNTIWTAGHVTVRIAREIDNSTPYEVISSSNSNFDSLMGTSAGEGVIQVCNGVVDSNNCLVTINGGVATTPLDEVWDLNASGISFSPDGTVASVPIQSGISPGQSVTFSFDLSIPAINSNDIGEYYALMNAVVFTNTQTNPSVVAYSVEPFNVGTGIISGILSIDGIAAIGGVAMAIIGLLGLALKRF